MAGKRSAARELNHDNWDRDEDAEEAGQFQKASEEVLKKWVIRTAKRRVVGGSTPQDDDNGEKKNIFGGFNAFAKTPSNPSAAFSFLAKAESGDAKTTNTTVPMFSFGNKSDTDAIKSSSLFSFGNKTTTDLNGGTKSFSSPSKVNGDGNKDEEEKDEKFLAKLKGLNESVSKWIKKHVDENPFVNLTPIFKDYEKYFNEMERMQEVKVSDETKKELSGFSFKSPVKTTSSTVASTFSFGNKTSAETSKPTPPITNTISTFSSGAESKFTFSGGNKKEEVKDSGIFSIKKDAKEETTTAKPFSFDTSKKDDQPKMTFGSPSATPSFFGSTPAQKFGGFTASTPFSFGSTQATSAPIPPSTTEATNNDEEDEPPKNEFTPVVEKDHIYTTRCKVFVKKDSDYTDRGVGNLYLKKVPESEKVQLIVRADTNLGNLLCNFLLNESIPMQRMGKNNVMIVCIPTPDSKPPPIPILLRVKTADDADKLLAELEKHKK